ncbi:MAG: phage tail tube protein, partial [Enhydrobacter sp.]
VLGDPYGLGLTVQVGRPDSSGTVQPFTYAGCKVDQLSLMNGVGDFLKAEMNIVGKSETTGTGLATAVYPITGGAASFAYLNWTQGAITIAGSPVGVVTDIKIDINNNIKSDRYFLGAATMNEPIIAAMTEISGSVTVEFDGLTNYNRFVNGTVAALTATWTGATAIESTTYPAVLVNLPNVRFDGDTPNVKGPDVITHDLKFKVLYDGSTGPITIDQTTTDTAV